MVALGGEADVDRSSPLANRDVGRVEMWRGGCRLNISVSASFV